MAVLLLAAASVSAFGLGKTVDAGAILAIVAANCFIALVQEGKAARALDALRRMETPFATVRRSGAVARIPATGVVPGDVVLLAAGDRVPADLRLTKIESLEIDESVFTGESLPVAKEMPERVEGSRNGDKTWLAFTGTLVVRGSGEGVVLATGPATQLGAIARHLEGPGPQTPLQRDLRRMTTLLGGIAVGVAAIVFGLALLRLGATKSGLERSFLSAAALAVAAVPEGLPTVVSVALAIGVRRMAVHGAIVRRLPAVETLGSTTVILTDKTGTLTENRMRVDGVSAGGNELVPLDRLPRDVADAVAEVFVLCNDASLDPPAGDPMEVALLEAAGAGTVAALRGMCPRHGVVPFDSTRKRMTTLNTARGGYCVFIKGAPEVVLERCDASFGAGGTGPLSHMERASILTQAFRLAERGERVLALARRRLASRPEDLTSAEEHLTLVGLVALRDPVRREAAGAISEAASAGIRVLMVTGDHPGTALAIAQEVGLAGEGAAVLTGAHLAQEGVPRDPLVSPVYARVDPDDKLALVEALQARGHVVAVTGDGVNDAPALRHADIGIAMGRAWSDVAREAADMVVTDDNLATIVTAVREGRAIYDNVRNVVEYLVAGNLSEILVVVSGLMFFPGLGVPLLPLQLLWINLLTDGFPALALGVDHVDREMMTRPPRAPGRHLLSGRRVVLLGSRGTLIAGAAVGSLAVARYAWDEPWAHARTTMFSVLMIAHLLYAFAVRGSRVGDARVNRWLVASVAGGIGLQALGDLRCHSHRTPRQGNMEGPKDLSHAGLLTRYADLVAVHRTLMGADDVFCRELAKRAQ